ncbi:OmpA family protein [Nocardia abscessus]|uniref:OmpA family protein n=1 Tax=Nocardia abscessus TaxID=120957 RepID=UPI00245429AE|nr:OmpA family protein [Nocardia abscessus]
MSFNVPRTAWLKLLLTLFTLTLGGLGLSACTADHSSHPSITLVVTATSAEPRPSLPNSIRAELISLAKQSKKPGQATVRIITSADGPIIERDLTPMRGEQVEHAIAAADRKIDAAITNVAEELANAKADTPGLALLPPIDRASTFPGSRMHVISSGVTTEAPTDFRRWGWNIDPTAAVDSVAHQGQISDLRGVSLTFHGLGIAAGTQPQLPPFARQTVRDVWLGICQRGNATSCAAEQEPIAARPPTSTLPVPVVPLPQVQTVGGCPAWMSLSDSVLRFPPDSPQLGVEADSVLAKLVDDAVRCRLRISITGHIADTGTGDCCDLSGQRARAVADRLLSLGLPADHLGNVIGRGAEQPVIVNITDGVFDEVKARLNRRVELSFERLS